jgi:hypothetical protein
MWKGILHNKLFKVGIIIAISGVLLIGIFVPFLTANFSSELYLRVDGKGMNRGDEKLILFVDAPDSGGKALSYAAFEVTSKGLRDSWDFFDSSSVQKHDLIVDLFAMDYVIIIDSDSNSNGKFDYFNLKLTVPNSPLYENYKGYNFGNKYGNNLIVGIWLLDKTDGVLSIFNSGWAVHKLSPGQTQSSYEPYYTIDDWPDLWSNLEYYFSTGDESMVENFMSNYDFPIPATIIY